MSTESTPRSRDYILASKDNVAIDNAAAVSRIAKRMARNGPFFRTDSESCMRDLHIKAWVGDAPIASAAA
jgi:hypothetical protein